MDKNKWLMATVLLIILTGMAVWYFHYQVKKQSLSVSADVSASVYESLLKTYSSSGFTEDEVKTLVGYVARSLANVVYPHSNVKDVSIGDVKLTDKGFYAENVVVYLDSAQIDIDNLSYENGKTTITFTLSKDADDGYISRLKAGKFYILYLQGGQWILGR